jgi:hypothetical protein
MQRTSLWPHFRKSRSASRLDRLRVNPHLEELEPRRQPAFLGLSLGGFVAEKFGMNLAISSQLGNDNAMQRTALLNSFVRIEVSLSLLEAQMAATLKMESFATPFPESAAAPSGSNPSQGGSTPSSFSRSPASGPFSNAPLGPFAQPVAQSNPGPSIGTAGAINPAAVLSSVPNYFFAFAQNGSTGGQVAVQPGFQSLIPNNFLQSQTTSGPTSIPIGITSPQGAPDTSTFIPPVKEPAILPLTQSGRHFLDDVGAASGETTEGNEQAPASPEGSESPGNPPNSKPPQEPDDGDQVQQMPLVPGREAAVSQAVLDDQGDQDETFWSSFWEDSLFDNTKSGPAEGRLGLSGVLAASFLALASEWMPPMDKRGWEEKEERNRLQE